MKSASAEVDGGLYFVLDTKQQYFEISMHLHSSLHVGQYVR